MFGLPFWKPPHPDTVRAWGTFSQSIRMFFYILWRRWLAVWENAERRMRSLGRWLMEKKPLLALSALTLIWLLPGLAQLPLVDRDEPRFAYATQEMIDRGDALVPTFNGENRFDKPPLVYWWMRAHYMIFGYNDFSARLHSVEAALLCVLLTYGFATRLYGPRVGWWSAIAFLTSLQVFLHGRLCVADMPMMVFIILIQWAAWELLQKTSWLWATIFWTAMALGFTTKWLVPAAVFGVAMLTYEILQWWSTRKQKLMPFATTPAAIMRFKPLFGAALMMALILAWAVPAWIETQGEFFKVGIGEHFFERGVSAFNARSYNPLFYIFSAFISLMPWLGLAGGVVSFLKNGFDDRKKYLIASVVGIYLLFSLAQTQLPHYVMPAFPSLLILIVAATGLRKPSATKSPWAARFYSFTNIVWKVLLSVGLLVTLFMPTHGSATVLKVAVLWVLLSLLSLVALGRAVSRGRMLRTVICFLLVPSFFCAGAFLLRDLNPVREITQQLDATNLPQKLIANGFEEPSLVAYTQASWSFQGDYFKAKADFEQSKSAAFVALGEEISLESVPAILLKKPVRARRDNQKNLFNHPPLAARQVRFEGVDLGRFSWVSGELYLKP